MQVLYLLAECAAEILKGLPSYSPYLSEQHHHRKKDAPSGTARHLRRILEDRGLQLPEVAVLRAGEIPGTHEIGFDSKFDTVTLKHTARSRDGFAEGALMACHWIRNRSGFHEFKEILGEY